jgi:hypothetical protein
VSAWEHPGGPLVVSAVNRAAAATPLPSYAAGFSISRVANGFVLHLDGEQHIAATGIELEQLLFQWIHEQGKRVRAWAEGREE